MINQSDHKAEIEAAKTIVENVWKQKLQAEQQDREAAVLKLTRQIDDLTKRVPKGPWDRMILISEHEDELNR